MPWLYRSWLLYFQCHDWWILWLRISQHWTIVKDYPVRRIPSRFDHSTPIWREILGLQGCHLGMDQVICKTCDLGPTSFQVWDYMILFYPKGKTHVPRSSYLDDDEIWWIWYPSDSGNPYNVYTNPYERARDHSPLWENHITWPCDSICSFSPLHMWYGKASFKPQCPKPVGACEPSDLVDLV